MIKNFFNELTRGFRELPEGLALVTGEAKKLRFGGVMKAFWDDMFAKRSLSAWLYLIVLTSVPFILEFTSGTNTHDWLGLTASVTGIICVILVSEGRTSNYFFGTINSIVYLYMALDATFYGEVVTTVYFFIMQPIGLYLWLKNRLEVKDEEELTTDIKVKKLDLKGWIKYLLLTAIVWLGMGFAYKGINSARPFRDSVTDGTNYVGQLLMNQVYQEQWLFWIATNLFSIYLWWGSNIHIQGMYWVYTINSIVGWYNWNKQVKVNKAEV